jgi:hypothetical protein
MLQNAETISLGGLHHLLERQKQECDPQRWLMQPAAAQQTPHRPHLAPMHRYNDSITHHGSALISAFVCIKPVAMRMQSWRVLHLLYRHLALDYVHAPHHFREQKVFAPGKVEVIAHTTEVGPGCIRSADSALCALSPNMLQQFRKTCSFTTVQFYSLQVRERSKRK